ncbi:hypothetical protein C8J56DRAFT_1170665 [Mycena floridula]|nr:hypothetical protein C8J56DRAFT_1170665 [Mycena floridula]
MVRIAFVILSAVALAPAMPFGDFRFPVTRRSVDPSPALVTRDNLVSDELSSRDLFPSNLDQLFQRRAKEGGGDEKEDKKGGGGGGIYAKGEASGAALKLANIALGF